MTTDPTRTPLHALMAHREWVRDLARRLVADAATADDLEQETWLAALRRPPARGSSPRAWLGSVLRRQAARRHRSASRRTRREVAVARDEATVAPTDDVVAHAELRRDLIEHVLALAEPYRTTLLRRFYEGHPPREIAALDGVAVETVRSRVRRGLAMLRGRLDREHGGDRRTWCGLFSSLAAQPSGAPTAGIATTSIGGLVMTIPAKSIVLAVALLLGLLLWRVVGWGDAHQAPRDVATASDSLRPPRESQAAHRSESVDSGDVGTQAAGEAPEVDASERSSAIVVVSRPTGEALEQADVLVLDKRGERKQAGPLDDVRGDLNEWESPLTIWASAPGHALRLLHNVCPEDGGVTIALEPAPALRVRFVDTHGATMPPHAVRERYARQGGVPQVDLLDAATLAGDEMNLLDLYCGATDRWHRQSELSITDDGVFLPFATSGTRWIAVVWTPTGAPRAAWIERSPDSSPVTVELDDPADTVRVRVFAEDSAAPLVNASVTPYFEFGDDRAFVPGPQRRTDAAGEVLLPQPRPRSTEGTGGRAPTWWVTSEERGVAVTLPRRGLGHASQQPLEIQAPRYATIEGRAYRADGSPGHGLFVAHRSKGMRVDGAVGAEGQFRLGRVPVGRGQGLLFLVEDLASGDVVVDEIRLRGGETTVVDLGRPAKPTAARLELRLTAGGTPLEGAYAKVEGAGNEVFRITDAAGACTLPNLNPGPLDVTVQLTPALVDDFRLRLDEGVRLAASEQRLIEVDLPGGAIRVRCVDAETGIPIEGALTMARPSERESATSAVPGWHATLGWAAGTSSAGEADLFCLEPARSHDVIARAPGYDDPEPVTLTPGTREAPAEVTLRFHATK